MKKITLMLMMFLFGTGIAQAKVANNSPAPEFSLRGDDGKTHTLSSNKGKYVVLEWYNEGCPYVKKHYNSGNMQGLQKELIERKQNDVVWYSVISSKAGSQGHADVKGAAALRKAHNINSTAILLDTDGNVGKAYGASTTPHLFVINPEGKVVYQGAIDDQPSANKETLKNAKNYVKMAFADLDAKKQIAQAETQPYGCSVKY